jgi:hypothetical protein
MVSSIILKVKTKPKELGDEELRRTNIISFLAFAMIIQCFIVLLKLIFFKPIRPRVKIFNITDLLCALSC